MLPLSAQSHIIALLQSNEKSFTLFDGFGKSALLRVLNQKTSLEKHGMADVFKRVLVYMAKRNKRGTRVYISRAS